MLDTTAEKSRNRHKTPTNFAWCLCCPTIGNTDVNERAKTCRTVKSWLESEPRLIRYRNASKFSFLLDSDPGFRGLRTLAGGGSTSLYAKYGDAFPILGIEKPDGELIFKMSALSLAKNAGDCGDRVTTAIKGKRKKRQYLAA
jgi:hypothetical protein